ncbi:MAG: rhodanese-like domain-containing protein [Armatimonadetes bacterium]|nr:rhodanese-like domain-containing protein [Armatimonadota bacterium]
MEIRKSSISILLCVGALTFIPAVSFALGPVSNSAAVISRYVALQAKSHDGYLVVKDAVNGGVLKLIPNTLKISPSKRNLPKGNYALGAQLNAKGGETAVLDFFFQHQRGGYKLLGTKLHKLNRHPLYVWVQTGKVWSMEPPIPIGIADPWKPNQLITVPVLYYWLSSSDRPIIYHVGVPFLYKMEHIPDSIHVGHAATPDGIASIGRALAKLPRDRNIVIYCGCCPWLHCPNIRPAFALLKKMGFTRLKALYLPDSFDKDWAKRGYPIQKGD